MTALTLQSVDKLFADDRPQRTVRESMAVCASRVIHSGELLGSERAVVIEHEGYFYRLQKTKLGKLILTK